jgi:hypothetical protein
MSVARQPNECSDIPSRNFDSEIVGIVLRKRGIEIGNFEGSAIVKKGRKIRMSRIVEVQAKAIPGTIVGLSGCFVYSNLTF